MLPSRFNAHMHKTYELLKCDVWVTVWYVGCRGTFCKPYSAVDLFVSLTDMWQVSDSTGRKEENLLQLRPSFVTVTDRTRERECEREMTAGHRSWNLHFLESMRHSLEKWKLLHISAKGSPLDLLLPFMMSLLWFAVFGKVCFRYQRVSPTIHLLLSDESQPLKA